MFYQSRLKGIAFFAVVGLLAFSTSAFAADTNYHVVDTSHLPGAAEWDALTYDLGTHRLFITHGDHVDIFDTKAKKITGTIANTDGVHGVALAPDIKRGFTSNSKAGTVTIFDLSSLKPISTVAVEKKPDIIVYDALTKRVFVPNVGSNNISVIDAVAGKNIGTIAVDGMPEFAVVDRKGRLYANIRDKNQIAVVDTRKLQVVSRYDLSPTCEKPIGLAIDIKKQRLFAGCRNEKMVVVDANSGKVIADVPIGKNNDGTVFDDGSQLVFNSNGDGTLTVIGNKGNHFTVRQVVKTMPSARTMALDKLSHKIYLVGAEIDHIDQPTPEQPHPKPTFKDNSFTLITVAP